MGRTAVAVLRADFAASCLRGALPSDRGYFRIHEDTCSRTDVPPVDLRAVCLVRAISKSVVDGVDDNKWVGWMEVVVGW